MKVARNLLIAMAGAAVVVTWMVASVTTLNQHSKTVMETLASAAENRLREACSQALTGLAQTLSDQVRAISAQFAALPPSTPEGPANEE